MIFGIIVPLIINECYKVPNGYVTVWDGAEVLAYYGLLLGSIITIVTLVKTIQFNRNQILEERKLLKEQEQWKEISDAISEVLMHIHPYKLKNVIIDNSINSIAQCVSILCVYETSAKMSLDNFKNYTDIQLWDEHQKNDEQIIQLLQDFTENAESVFEKSLAIKDSYLLCFQGKENVDNIQFVKELIEIQKSIEKLYSTEYAQLLKTKILLVNDVRTKKHNLKYL